LAGLSEATLPRAALMERLAEKGNRKRCFSQEQKTYVGPSAASVSSVSISKVFLSTKNPYKLILG
jgi:hypothetical protein